MDKIYNYFIEGLQDNVESRKLMERRIGAELKFPLVNPDGTAVDLETVCALWKYLQEKGWKPVKDKMTGKVIGATKPGPRNDTQAGCETGFCKTEFSLAHVSNLFDLTNQINQLREELREFCDRHDVLFLGYGIHPVTRPNKKLLMKKGRTTPWAKVFGSNRHISKKDGDDMHLLTINAASHVHVSVAKEEIVDAVNVLNGFAGAQLALTANSNVWRGKIDPRYKCVAEKFWDWWMPDKKRFGVPHKQFEDIQDYVETIADFKPVYVVRNKQPIILTDYDSFSEYFNSGRAKGVNTRGEEISFVPRNSDIDLHNSCYWYNARISRYYTVENRVNDQQPPEELVCISALTLGLISALEDANRELSNYDWSELRSCRDVACREGLNGKTGRIELKKLALRMLYIAKEGLLRRGLGEEVFLEPLQKRLCDLKCPADNARQIFQKGGPETLVEKCSI